MSVLTDDQLDHIYNKGWQAHEPEIGCHAAGLRAVADAAVQAEFNEFKAAYNEWHDKTEWVQGDHCKELGHSPLGMHRADVIKALVLNLRKRVSALESVQEPREDLFESILSPTILAHISKADELVVRRIWDDVRRAMLATHKDAK